MIDRIETITGSALTWLVTFLLGGIVWLVRRVLTNQKQLDILEQELRNRERLRNEDRERMAKIESDIKDVRNYLIGKR